MVQTVKLEIAPHGLPCVTNEANDSTILVLKDRMLAGFTQIKPAFNYLYHRIFEEWPPKKIAIVYTDGYYRCGSISVSESAYKYMRSRVLENKTFTYRECPSSPKYGN